MSHLTVKNAELLYALEANGQLTERLKKLKREHAAMKKARKIDAYALAQELGPKISLNFNEWEMIARAVEAQLIEKGRKA